MEDELVPAPLADVVPVLLPATPTDDDTAGAAAAAAVTAVGAEVDVDDDGAADRAFNGTRAPLPNDTDVRVHCTKAFTNCRCRSSGRGLPATTNRGDT